MSRRPRDAEGNALYSRAEYARIEALIDRGIRIEPEGIITRRLTNQSHSKRPRETSKAARVAQGGKHAPRNGKRPVPKRERLQAAIISPYDKLYA